MTNQPPTSLRIPQQLRDRVERWAAEQGLSRNGAYVQLIAQALKAVGPHPGLNERPLPARVKSWRAQDKAAAEPMRLPKSAPGSRLKGAKK